MYNSIVTQQRPIIIMSSLSQIVTEYGCTAPYDED